MGDASQINCPHCGQTYFVQPEQWAQYQGQTINCTRCGREFQVGAPATGAPVMPPPIPQQVRPMQSAPMQAAPMQSAPMNVGPNSPFEQRPTMGYAGAPVPTSGWAIASLIVGIAGFCVPLICSVFAIIAGFIGLSQTKEGRATGRGMAIAGIILGFAGLALNILMLGAVMVPALSQARQAANQVKCASNMRQIGLAMLMYANAHNNEFPGQLADLAKDPSAPPANTYVCPDDKRTAPSGASTSQTIVDLNSGNHCSYIYVGTGISTTAASDTVLMYEDVALQHRFEVNVLFADGHVERESVSAVQSAIQTAAGKGPMVIAGSSGQ